MSRYRSSSERFWRLETCRNAGADRRSSWLHGDSLLCAVSAGANWRLQYLVWQASLAVAGDGTARLFEVGRVGKTDHAGRVPS